MSMRRDGRIAAVQLLYQLDVRDWLADADEVVARHFAHLDPEAEAEVRDFSAALCRGVAAHREELDALIARCADNWRLERMSYVDRNVLRVATFELCYCPDVPERVALDEAIEVARHLGATESSAFVNGVLARVLKERAR